MTFGEARFAGLAFSALMVTVALNLFAFQERRPAPIETSALAPLGAGSASGANAGTTAPAGDTTGALAEPSGESTPVAGVQRALPPAVVATPGVSQAEIVRGVQRELAARGYQAGQPDGIAGTMTRAAIMAYEHDYGLALTGLASEDLLNRIVLGSSAQPEVNRAEPDVILSSEARTVVKLVTQGLAAQGYKPGEDAGTLSAETRRAIMAFEAAQQLPQTGRISAALVGRLMKLQAQAPVAAVGRGRGAQR